MRPTLSLVALVSIFTSVSAYQQPPTTLSNGALNPFYPCGATTSQVTNCPYRCYTASLSPTLEPHCYSGDEASSLINAGTHTCLKCLTPLPSEIPKSKTAKTCVPIAHYFTDDARPSRCGYPGAYLPACAWNCAEAQVPFSTCATKNNTGELESCVKCEENCSTPRIVFDPPTVPDFSLSKGTCETDPEGAARFCIYRCKDDGNQNMYCSLNDKSAEFTNCTACSG